MHKAVASMAPDERTSQFGEGRPAKEELVSVTATGGIPVYGGSRLDEGV